MKKKTQTIALFAVLSLAAVGCQKENANNFACGNSGLLGVAGMWQLLYER